MNRGTAIELAIGATAVGLGGREAIVSGASSVDPVLLLAMCVIVYLQSTSILSWMVP
jgi:lactate permease